MTLFLFPVLGRSREDFVRYHFLGSNSGEFGYECKLVFAVDVRGHFIRLAASGDLVAGSELGPLDFQATLVSLPYYDHMPGLHFFEGQDHCLPRFFASLLAAINRYWDRIALLVSIAIDNRGAALSNNRASQH